MFIITRFSAPDLSLFLSDIHLSLCLMLYSCLKCIIYSCKSFLLIHVLTIHQMQTACFYKICNKNTLELLRPGRQCCCCRHDSMRLPWVQPCFLNKYNFLSETSLDWINANDRPGQKLVNPTKSITKRHTKNF
jgi:hypothetical protein